MHYRGAGKSGTDGGVVMEKEAMVLHMRME